MQTDIAYLSQRAGRAICEFNGNVPVKREAIEGRGGSVKSRPNLLMQPPIDMRHGGLWRWHGVSRT